MSLSTLAPPCQLAALFHELATKWRQETAFLSSTTEIATHPAYQRIIGFGPQAIPLILAELRKKPEPWFWALTAITGEDPVATDDQGKIQAMAKAWLDWGHENGWLA